MTQIVSISTLTSLLWGAWHPSRTVSTVLTPHRRHVPAGPAVGAGLAARPGHGCILRGVRPAGAALPAGGCRDQAGQLQVLASAAVSVSDGPEDQLGVLPR